MNHLLILLVLSVLNAFACGTKFTDCGSTTGKVNTVQVTDCPDGADQCTLKRGTDARIVINFLAKAATKTLEASVHGVIASVPLPFPLPESDGCKTGVSCPVKSGETYTYNNTLNVRNSYPPIAVRVRWELKDENSADMVCIEIPCRLQ